MADADVDMEKLEISFPVASETPYRRFDYWANEEYLEVLRCNSDAIDLARLNNGASVLKNHNGDEVIGTVLKAWIEDARLWVRVKLRQADEKIKNLFEDMAQGIIRNVSIGYTQNEITRDGDFGYVTKWTPLEVSMAVGVPADYTVGVFRSASDDERKIMHRNMESDNNNKENRMKEIEELKKELDELKKELDELKKEPDELKKELNEDQETPAEEAPEETPEETKETPEETGKKVEDTPAEEAPKEPEPPAEETKAEGCNPDESEIRSLGSIAGVAADEIDRCLQRGMNIENFRTHIKSLNINVRKDNKMSKNYSFFRALQAAAGLNVDASLERQVSDELYSSVGRCNSNPNSIMIRANEFIGTGSGATGTGLIGTEHRGDMFVELLRAKMGVRNFTALTGLRSNLEIPVQSASTTAEVKGVNDALTTQKMGVSTITLTPKKFGATVTVGKDLLAQSNPDAAAFVIRDIEAQIARKLDAAILTGSTDPLIKGVKTTTGVQTVAISDLTKATWKDFTKFFGKIGQYDLSSTPEWVMTAADAQDLKSISKDSGSGRYIMEDGKIDGFAVNMAGTIASGNIFLGNWADVLVGQWGGLELIIDPYTRASNGMLVITATLLADVGIRNPEGFVMRTAA